MTYLEYFEQNQLQDVPNRPEELVDIVEFSSDEEDFFENEDGFDFNSEPEDEVNL